MGVQDTTSPQRVCTSSLYLVQTQPLWQSCRLISLRLTPCVKLNFFAAPHLYIGTNPLLSISELGSVPTIEELI